MPGGNGTGPLGMGPRTGRAAGYCAGFGQPGYINNSPGGFLGGWGRGFQRGGGRGRGRGRGYFPANGYPYPAAAAEENNRISNLEQQAKYLAESLESIHQEIASLKSRRGTD